MVTERSSTIGPVGRQVIANIERLRKDRRLSLRDLSERLAEAGRPIAKSQIRALSKAERRVDADDLAAFAEVLGVDVTSLLAPPGAVAGRPPAHPLLASPLLTTEQLAEYLGDVSTRTLEDWRLRGIGPDYVPLSPKMVRYRVAAVERWLDGLERSARDRTRT
jgi:transcriptional regulator with XRE-family HTH domain